MESNVETKFGTVTVRNAMLDIDGHTLDEGIEIKLDGILIGEIVGVRFDKDDYEELEAIEIVENWVENYCEY